jgi:hypothetical protein
MKKSSLFLWMFFICLGIVSAKDKTVTITISNHWNDTKTDEPVVLNLKDLNLDFDVSSAVVTDGKDEIPSQLDDLDGDLIPDELAFVIDVKPLQSKNLKISFSSDRKQKQYNSRVYAEMLVSDKNGKHVPVLSLTIPGTSNIYDQLHHHGPAFESELTAYRIYFDQKQTVDIYGKFNKGFEIKESQFYPTDEQLARGFGDDVLRVSGSCGLGTLKGWDGKKATHIEPVVSLTETVVANGPVRSIVDVIAKGWQYQNAVLTMKVRYVQYAGHRDCEVQVSFAQPLGKEIFTTGVQNIAGSVSSSDHEGLIACWGRDWPVNDTVKYAKETVGLATCLPADLVVSEINDKANYLYQIQAAGRKGFTYHITFTSMKETFGYKTPKAWFDFVTQWKEALKNKCEIKTTGL